MPQSKCIFSECQISTYLVIISNGIGICTSRFILVNNDSHHKIFTFVHMSRDMRFSTMWYVRPAKHQISLRIRAVWSETLLVAWIVYEYQATDRTSLGVAMHRHVWVYNCQNATLLEITCLGSIMLKTYLAMFFSKIMKGAAHLCCKSYKNSSIIVARDGQICASLYLQASKSSVDRTS